MGTVILVYVHQTKYLNHRNNELVNHTSKPKIKLKILTGPLERKHPNQDYRRRRKLNQIRTRTKTVQITKGND